MKTNLGLRPNASQAGTSDILKFLPVHTSLQDVSPATRKRKESETLLPLPVMEPQSSIP